MIFSVVRIQNFGTNQNLNELFLGTAEDTESKSKSTCCMKHLAQFFWSERHKQARNNYRINVPIQKGFEF